MHRSLFLLAGLAASALQAVLFPSCSPSGGKTVVVYVSEDQVFSEPVLKAFEKETGIRVRALYDTEEAKSTGVVNRLLAERNNPQADVYWANEPIRAEVLKQKGIAVPYFSPAAKGIPEGFKDPRGFWTGFSARLRVLVVRKGLPGKPTGVGAFTDPAWKGKAVIANPLFGTTTAHVAALFNLWGDARAETFLEGMKKNEVALSSNNGESADFVAAGKYDFSLVDSDDVIARVRRGRPVELVYPDQGPQGPGCFLVPNAVVLIRGCPHPEEGKKLIDYLLSAETEARLARADCAQLPLRPGVPPPPELKPLPEIKVLEVDYGKVAGTLDRIQPYLRTWAGL